MENNEKNFNVNSVKLGGNLVEDAKQIVQEVTRQVYAFTVANNRGDKVNFVEVVAELGAPLAKGTFVVVEGTLQQRKFEVDGKKRSSLRINAKTVKVYEKKAEGTEEAAAPAEGETVNA
ncbi:MAG: single-stranded DNA-binding protein [Nitrospinae bacterium]|nr:single-stranded DNA-binding protein [Nitrospinota bacterium]